MYKRVQDLKLKNFFNMYEYRLDEQEDSLEQFQQKRIDAFDEIEDKLDDLKKLLWQAKIATVKYYRQDEPKSYSVVYGTDLIKDYIKDIETLLLDNWYENITRTV